MNEIIEKPKTETKQKTTFTTNDFWSPSTYEDVLPNDVEPAVFARVCKRAMNTTNNLWECAKGNPQQVLNALIECAQDGLMPDGKEAALVAFWDKRNERYNLTYIPMLKGVVARLHKSGQIKSIALRMVFENDDWKPVYGDNEHFHHIPASGKSGDPIGVYCIVKTVNGGIYRDFMDVSEINVLKQAAFKKVGGADKKYRTPWGGDHEFEMWKKSPLKRLAKILPISSNDRRMLDRDNVLYDIGVQHVETEKTKPKFLHIAKDNNETVENKPAQSNEVKLQKNEPEKNRGNIETDWLSNVSGSNNPGDIVEGWTALQQDPEFQSLSAAKKELLRVTTMSRVDELEAELPA